MLNQLAFANSLAVLTAVLYVLFTMLALVAPRLFQILFDAQFFGANVASLFPKVQPSAASSPREPRPVERESRRQPAVFILSRSGRIIGHAERQ